MSDLLQQSLANSKVQFTEDHCEDSASLCSNLNDDANSTHSQNLNHQQHQHPNNIHQANHLNVNMRSHPHLKHLDSGNTSNENLSDTNLDMDNLDKFATMSPLSPDAAFNLRLRLAQIKADRDSLQLCLKQTHHALKLIQLDHSISQTENNKLKTINESLLTELEEEKKLKDNLQAMVEKQNSEIEELKISLNTLNIEKQQMMENQEGNFRRSRINSISSIADSQSGVAGLDLPAPETEIELKYKLKLEQTELKLNNAERRQRSHLATVDAAKAEIANLKYQLSQQISNEVGGSANEKDQGNTVTIQNNSSLTKILDTENKKLVVDLKNIQQENSVLREVLG